MRTLRIATAIAALLAAPLLAALSSARAQTPATAQESGLPTGCDHTFLARTGYQMYDGRPRFEKELFQVFAMAADAPLYRDEQGDARADRTMAFTERNFIADPGKAGGTRVQLNTPGGQAIGWAARDDILCRPDPLQMPETNLIRRMVVRTETEVQGEVRPKDVYPGPAAQCPPSGCLQVSRFQWYFIYHEMNDMVLLAEPAQLRGPQTRLLGWLPKGDGIAWNTAAGLRTSLDPQVRQGPGGASGKFACAYIARGDIGQAEKCRPILGGKQWYEIDVRMPVLADEGQVYEVAVSPVARAASASELNVAELKKIDLFFVIDGTKSMGPVIDTIRGLVPRLQARFNPRKQQGSVLRLGFRIYRDSVKGGADGITNSESLVPPAGNCTSNDEEFTRRFATVKAEDFPGDTDYSENSFGGLHKAGEDLVSCPGHLKIIFHIGDHGYDGAEQQKRGHRWIKESDLVARFKRGAGGVQTQPILSVIQTPSSKQGVQRPEDYDRAYNDFESQAKSLLKAVYQGTPIGAASGRQPTDFFHRLRPGNIDEAVIDQIMQPVDALMQPEALARIQEGLSAGQSLEDTIRLMRSDNRMTVPGLFYDVVVPELCRRLGEQCRQKTLEAVFTAFMPHSPDLETDVILDDRQLRDWIGLLGAFNDMINNAFRTGSKTRQQMVQLYLEALATRFRIIPDDSGPNLQQFVGMRGGLPYGARSPFLAYDPAELRDERKVVRCEIEHLADYSAKRWRILEALQRGTNLIEMTTEELTQQLCSNPTPKGQAIPIIKEWRTRPLNVPPADIKPNGEPKYSYKFSKSGTTFYWINNKYLP